MRSRSSSRAQEAHNGSDSSKAKSKKAKDTEKSSNSSSASGAKADDDKHRENEQYTKSRAVPIYCNFSFCIDEFPCLICPSRHRLTIVTKAEIDKQERKHSMWEPTDMSQAAYSCKNWTGYKRDCEHNGRQPPCTLGSMWRHARTALTDAPCIHYHRLEHWSCPSQSRA